VAKRHPRDGIRDRWVPCILSSEIGTASKLLLMFFAHRMGDQGTVAIPRDELARLFDVHPQRIAERIAEAKRAGLLSQIGGGSRGRIARYEALIPAGLHTAQRYPIEGKRTGERYAEIGTLSDPSEGEWVPPSGYLNARALVDNHSERVRDDRNFGSAPDPDERQGRSEERVPGHSPVDANSPDHAGSATKNRKASAA
jgi:hypothetical protein